MRILLADDDREVAEYVRNELEHEGHSVSVCHDGAAALRAAQIHAFDIIILDVMIPFMDGVEVTRHLRRDSIQTPILLLTARDAPDEVVRGLDSGADVAGFGTAAASVAADRGTAASWWNTDYRSRRLRRRHE